MSQRRPRATKRDVAAGQLLALQLSQAMEQAGAALYHLGALAASAYRGALEHGMPEERASDVADSVLAHLMHTALPLQDGEDDDLWLTAGVG